MRRLDRYVLTEFAGPLVFGLGVFFTLLAGVDLVYDALRYIIRENMPAAQAMAIIGYRVPMLVSLTVPMSALFAALLCFSRLSSEGEITAMRAGGIPVARISAAAILAALAMSAVMGALAHTLVPWCNGRSKDALLASRNRMRDVQGLIIRIPESGSLDRLIYVDRLNLSAGRMDGLIIHEFRNGRPIATYVAQHARWDGRRWILQGVEHTSIRPDGVASERLDELVYDLGRTPEDIKRIRYDPDELTTAELKRELQIAVSGAARDLLRQARIRTEIATRWAAPWSITAFVLVGIALGVRPQRTSKGVALGMSLVIILAYYIVMHSLAIVSEQGRLPAWLCAWAPNVALLTIGAAGLIAHDR
ncbi:MAG: LptF/LptG family permease [Armatimonadetes bacterium]|nr:LptF/LptG family permease [Armatimonadota bacterium]